MLAKELVRSRRQKDRIVTSKAQLNSISMQLQHQLCKFFCARVFFIESKTSSWSRLTTENDIYLREYTPCFVTVAQIATLKIAGTLQKSSEVMSMVNNLVKLPEISAQMQEMSREMMKVRA